MRRYSFLAIGEHVRHAAGQHGVDIASERPDVLDDARGQRARNLEVRAARAFVRKRLLQVGRPFAGCAFFGQEILAQAVHQQARHPEGLLVVYRSRPEEAAQIRCKHPKSRRVQGPAGDEGVQPPAQRAVKPFDEILRRARGREVLGDGADGAGEHRCGDEPPIDQAAKALAQLPLAQPREDQRGRGIGERGRTADSQGPIQRFVHEAERLGFIRHPEARIEIGFEREFAEQRQAERIDRADCHILEVIAQGAPDGGLDAALVRGTPQRREDAIAHLRRGLARERDREDVPRLDTCADEIDIAIDQDPRLARACGGLEHDVAPRIYRRRTIGGVGERGAFRRWALERRLVKRQARDRAVPLRHSLSGRHRPTRTSRKDCGAPGGVETRRARSRRDS